MGLTATILKGVQTAFSVAGDIVKDATYYLISETQSGGVPTETETTQTLKILQENYVERVHGDNVEGADIIISTPYEDFTGTPSRDDKIKVGDETFTVLSVRNEGNLNVLYVFQVKS